MAGRVNLLLGLFLTLILSVRPFSVGLRNNLRSSSVHTVRMMFPQQQQPETKFSSSSLPFKWNGKALKIENGRDFSIRPNLRFLAEFLEQQNTDVLETEGYELPLYPDISPLLPGSRNVHFVQEMRFRSLFADAEKKCNNQLVR